MDRKIESETDAYATLLHWYVSSFVARLRKLPNDRWEWQITPPAPSGRILAEHTWQCLVCDRQHLREPDVNLHINISAPPLDQQAMCDTLQDEADTWRDLIMSLTPAQLDEPRSQFGVFDTNVRWFICHMIQNCIYKHGQFATIYFAIGLDGDEPYTCPFPNPLYELMRKGELE